MDYLTDTFDTLLICAALIGPGAICTAPTSTAQPPVRAVFARHILAPSLVTVRPGGTIITTVAPKTGAGK